MDRNIIKISFLFRLSKSLSVRRAWIEIVLKSAYYSPSPKSLSVRRAWIEITSEVSERVPLASLSVRRAWIEIEIIRPAIDVFLGRSP